MTLDRRKSISREVKFLYSWRREQPPLMPLMPATGSEPCVPRTTPGMPPLCLIEPPPWWKESFCRRSVSGREAGHHLFVVGPKANVPLLGGALPPWCRKEALSHPCRVDTAPPAWTLCPPRPRAARARPWIPLSRSPHKLEFASLIMGSPGQEGMGCFLWVTGARGLS